MKRIISVLLASGAVAVLVHAAPASACGAQQKTTTKADEKAVPRQQVTAAERQPGKGAEAKPAPQPGAGAQAKNDSAATRPQQR